MYDDLHFSDIAMSVGAYPAATWTITRPWGSWMEYSLGSSSYREAHLPYVAD